MTDVPDDSATPSGEEAELLDRRGYRRPAATMPGFHRDRRPASAGKTRPPKVLPEAFIVGLIEACSSDPVGQRTATAITLLWRTGIKATELEQLRVGDLDLTPGEETVHIRGTGAVDRRLGLDAVAATQVRSWLAFRCELPGEHLLCVLHGPSTGADWPSTDLRKRFRDLSSRVQKRDGLQIEGTLSPNDFRVTLVAELILEQWPLPYLQTQLGLNTLETFRVLIPQLGIEPAAESEVSEIARTRPLPEGYLE